VRIDVGAVVAERYQVEGVLGQGGMGAIYRARDLKFGDPVALKVAAGAGAAYDEFRARFQREARIGNRLGKLPGFVRAIDWGELPDGVRLYLAMDLVEDAGPLDLAGGPRRARVERLLQAARLVADAHRAGIVHRDVKPENVLVTRDGRRAKLMDFGVAVIRDLGDFEGQVFRSIEGSLTGTPEYMSPEQATGDAVTAKSDLYSMGCVLYRMLAGRLPFESETSRGWVTCHMLEEPLPLDEALPRGRSVPGELQALVERLLDKLPDERPADAGAVVEALDALLPRVRRSTSGGLFGLFRGR